MGTGPAVAALRAECQQPARAEHAGADAAALTSQKEIWSFSHLGINSGELGLNKPFDKRLRFPSRTYFGINSKKPPKNYKAL